MRRHPGTELRAATGSLERLEQWAAAAAVTASATQDERMVVLTRLHAQDEELLEAMPPGSALITLISRVIVHAAGLPVVVLTPHACRLAPRILRTGARAVLASDADDEQIVAALACAFRGLRVMPAAAPADRAADAALTTAPEPLTPRELEIFGLLAAGDSNKTIAARLSISVHTVKYHISSILAKLGVASRTEAVALGLRLGIVLL